MHNRLWGNNENAIATQPNENQKTLTCQYEQCLVDVTAGCHPLLLVQPPKAPHLQNMTA
jgi:hypothetical protein